MSVIQGVQTHIHYEIEDKVDRYSVLAGGVRRLHHVKTRVITIVIRALGTVPKRLPKYLEDLGIA